MAAGGTELYASPRAVQNIASCAFYHVMEIPGVGLTENASWDLRGRETSYLGDVSLRGKRVLEIGPASGYLTFYMEAAGAEVVCVELASDEEWDIVPHADRFTHSGEERRAHMERLRNGFWFAHERYRSRARVHYGSAYHLPDELGHFDVAVMASVLLHLRDPLRVVTRCAELADILIVTDLHYEDLSDSRPLASLAAGNTPDTWWRFTPELVASFADILGLNDSTVTFHQQLSVVAGEPLPVQMFTVVSTRRLGAPPREAAPSEDGEPANAAVYADRLELVLQAQARELRLLGEHQVEVAAYVAHLLEMIAAKDAYIERLAAAIAAKDAYIERLGAAIRGERSLDDPA